MLDLVTKVSGDASILVLRRHIAAHDASLAGERLDQTFIFQSGKCTADSVADDGEPEAGGLDIGFTEAGPSAMARGPLPGLAHRWRRGCWWCGVRRRGRRAGIRCRMRSQRTGRIRNLGCKCGVSNS
jgi:hypothetical protein